METFIKGTYKKNIFSSNDGFTVGLIKIKDTNDQDLTDYNDKLFTFTGLFAELKLEEDYIFYGEVIDNLKYGLQYKVTKYEKIMPQDKDGLITFLSSDIFPKVGEKTAKNIVECLGENCLDKISSDYECLLKVPKMTEKKAMEIHSRLVKYNESYQTVIYLVNFGFSMKDALKIYNHYYEDTIRVVENNPYELIDTIDGISFNKIDELREKTNVSVDDERRIEALIISIMKNICFQKGDTYLDFNTIYSAVTSVYELDINEEKVKYYLIMLCQLGKIIIEDDKYILYSYYKAENYISTSVYNITNKEDVKIKDIDLKIERLELFFDIKYNEEQIKAIKQALVKNFSIITGGPGTGKSATSLVVK